MPTQHHLTAAHQPCTCGQTHDTNLIDRLLPPGQEPPMPNANQLHGGPSLSAIVRIRKPKPERALLAAARQFSQWRRGHR